MPPRVSGRWARSGAAIAGCWSSGRGSVSAGEAARAAVGPGAAAVCLRQPPTPGFMFITLLIVTFLIASAVALVVSRWFAAPIQRILAQIVDVDITYAWTMYLRFAVLVVGISSGVR